MPPCAASDPRVFTGPKLKAGEWNTVRGYDIFSAENSESILIFADFVVYYQAESV